MELGLESRELLETLHGMGERVQSASSTIEAPVVHRVTERVRASRAAAEQARSVAPRHVSRGPAVTPAPDPGPFAVTRVVPAPRPPVAATPGAGGTTMARPTAPTAAGPTPKPGLRPAASARSAAAATPRPATPRPSQVQVAASNPPELFISYHRGDEDIFGLAGHMSQRIPQHFYALTGMRLQVFIDIDQPGGIDWEKRIRSAADTATFFLPLLTVAYLNSEYCMKEVRWCLSGHSVQDRALTVVPVNLIPRDFLFRHCPDDARETLAELDRLNWVDATDAVVDTNTGGALKKFLTSLTAGTLVQNWDARGSARGSAEAPTATRPSGVRSPDPFVGEWLKRTQSLRDFVVRVSEDGQLVENAAGQITGWPGSWQRTDQQTYEVVIGRFRSVLRFESDHCIAGTETTSEGTSTQTWVRLIDRDT